MWVGEPWMPDCLAPAAAMQNNPAFMPSLSSNRAVAETSEEALLAALRAGEDVAFTAFAHQHAGPMLAVARRIVGNEEDARDALQEAFLSAFKAIKTFEGGSRLSTWLHRIVVNAALMKLRSRKRAQERSIEDLLPKFLSDGHPVTPAAAWRETGDSEAQKKRKSDARSGRNRRAAGDLPYRPAPPRHRRDEYGGNR